MNQDDSMYRKLLFASKSTQTFAYKQFRSLVALKLSKILPRSVTDCIRYAKNPYAMGCIPYYACTWPMREDWESIKFVRQYIPYLRILNYGNPSNNNIINLTYLSTQKFGNLKIKCKTSGPYPTTAHQPFVTYGEVDLGTYDRWMRDLFVSHKKGDLHRVDLLFDYNRDRGVIIYWRRIIDCWEETGESFYEPELVSIW